MAQGIYADIYTLAASRDRLVIENFLHDFAEHWIESAESYELHVASTPQVVVLNDATSVLNFCQAHPEIEYSVYWRNAEDQEPLCAMAFFTPDGGAIIGLSVDCECLLEKMESKLRRHSSDGAVLRLYESSPPRTVQQFADALRHSSAQHDFCTGPSRNEHDDSVEVREIQFCLGQPKHGWLPIQLQFDDYRLSVAASNVLNDPISELIDLADLATFPRSGLRRICFWEEPSGYVLDAWHSGPSRMIIAIYSSSDLIPPMTALSETPIYQRMVRSSAFGQILVDALSKLLRDSEIAFPTHWRVNPSSYIERLLNLRKEH